MAPQRIRKTFSGFVRDLQIDLKSPCKFNLEGESFNSSEQYIQWTKAKYGGDKIAMDHILNCEDAADCKEVSRDITNLDRKGWVESAESLCFKGIQAKFLQNDHLMERLLDTGE